MLQPHCLTLWKTSITIKIIGVCPECVRVTDILYITHYKGFCIPKCLFYVYFSFLVFFVWI
jgi:hypothetical protein